MKAVDQVALRQASGGAVFIANIHRFFASGGGRNHRMGLYDGILVKENHILAAGSIGAAVAAAKASPAKVMIEVEVESLDELRQALDAGADMALLDDPYGLYYRVTDAVSVK